jgi:hypothetical protein
MTGHRRTGVLVIRVWVEAAADGQIRARVTEARDLDSGEWTSAGASSVDAIVARVQEWLGDFAEGAAESELR